MIVAVVVAAGPLFWLGAEMISEKIFNTSESRALESRGVATSIERRLVDLLGREALWSLDIDTTVPCRGVVH
jgi:hypothetical protein